MSKAHKVQVNVGSLTEMGKRFTGAWNRAVAGEQVDETHVTFLNVQTMLNTLSPRRLELLRYFRQHGANNVRELAQAQASAQRSAQPIGRRPEPRANIRVSLIPPNRCRCRAGGRPRRRTVSCQGASRPGGRSPAHPSTQSTQSQQASVRAGVAGARWQYWPRPRSTSAPTAGRS